MNRINDSVDQSIAKILQEDARAPNAEIARRIGMAASATHDRIRKLEQRGIIRGYEARLAPAAVGLDLLAFVFVRSSEEPGRATTGEQLARIPEILEVHHIAGEDCYLAKVRTANPEALGRLLREKVGKISTVTSTRSTIVMGTLKETASLPVRLPDEEEVARD